jgi:hypothetical protein
MLGVALDCQIRLIVILVGGSSKSQKFCGKLLATLVKDTEEIGFEVAYGYLGCIASVVSWWHQFHVKFAHITDVILHVFDTSSSRTSFLGCVVCLYHLGILAVLHGLNQDGTNAINFHHNQDILVALKRLGGELACFVGENGFV